MSSWMVFNYMIQQRESCLPSWISLNDLLHFASFLFNQESFYFNKKYIHLETPNKYLILVAKMTMFVNFLYKFHWLTRRSNFINFSSNISNESLRSLLYRKLSPISCNLISPIRVLCFGLFLSSTINITLQTKKCPETFERGKLEMW